MVEEMPMVSASAGIAGFSPVLVPVAG